MLGREQRKSQGKGGGEDSEGGGLLVAGSEGERTDTWQKKKNYRACSNINVYISVCWLAQCQTIWPSGCREFQHPAKFEPMSSETIRVEIITKPQSCINILKKTVFKSSNFANFRKLELGTRFSLARFRHRFGQVEHPDQARHSNILDSKNHIDTYYRVGHIMDSLFAHFISMLTYQVFDFRNARSKNLKFRTDSRPSWTIVSEIQWMMIFSSSLLIERRSSQSHCRSLHDFLTSLLICVHFGCNLAANFGCNRLKFMPEIVSKLDCAYIWSGCALRLESEQTPFSCTGRRFGYAALLDSCNRRLKPFWLSNWVSKRGSTSL